MTQEEKYCDLDAQGYCDEQYICGCEGCIHYHPADEKEEWLEKACEWLENNAYLYVEETDSLRESALIGDFRAAMKGGEQ